MTGRYWAFKNSVARRLKNVRVLDVEGDFEALLMKARPGAGIGCAPVSRSFD
jgi:hypothetical protein